MDQRFCLLHLPCSIYGASLARVSLRSWRQSGRICPARHRRLDAPFPDLHALHHPAPQAAQSAGTHPFSPHARPLCLFLCLLAFPDLLGPRPVVRSRRHVERCGQAPLRHRWIYGVRAADPARINLHGLVDPLVGWPPLAAASPRDLHQRYLRSHSLLLAGEIRRAQAALLWRVGFLAPGLANRGLVPAAKKTNSCESCNASRLRRRFHARSLNSGRGHSLVNGTLSVRFWRGTLIQLQPPEVRRRREKLHSHALPLVVGFTQIDDPAFQLFLCLRITQRQQLAVVHFVFEQQKPAVSAHQYGMASLAEFLPVVGASLRLHAHLMENSRTPPRARIGRSVHTAIFPPPR